MSAVEGLADAAVTSVPWAKAGDETTRRLPFVLPPELAADRPPEARGIPRDGVRMMVSDARSGRLEHTTFRELPRFLGPGDLLVVNASATLPASLAARWASGGRAGEPLDLHLSTPLPGGSARHWVIELRELTETGTASILAAESGDAVRLSSGGRARLLEPYRGSPRLWSAELVVPGGVLAFAERHGQPIRYGYVPDAWPLSDYQTLFSTERGSAEMPSAGRPFTGVLIDRLRAAGVRVEPLVLHTGVASLERDEPPYPERYRVPRATADAVNAAREAGHRVVAVGTTVVRALETVASPGGRVHPGAGWTDLVVNPERGIRVADGILTGLHEPTSSHLAMLEAFAGRAPLVAAYEAAIAERYLWHEFGDVHLIIGRGRGSSREIAREGHRALFRADRDEGIPDSFFIPL